MGCFPLCMAFLIDGHPFGSSLRQGPGIPLLACLIGLLMIIFGGKRPQKGRQLKERSGSLQNPEFHRIRMGATKVFDSTPMARKNRGRKREARNRKDKT